ncbi:MAG: TIGR03086 family protein [Candidatus Dormibacteraeota bacterium]|nr:TIGR03086 family protein [Candidatus Dormibacteraeota bacterium]
MTMDVRESLARAFDGFGGRVGAAAPDQWHAPTPCRQWDVHQLVNHVIGEVRWIEPLMAGRTIEDVGDALSGDLAGDEPAAAWNAAAAAAMQTVEPEDALDRTVHLSYGEVPAHDYLAEVCADVVIHTWDLARAIHGDEQMDAELVAAAAATLAPRLEVWREAGALAAAVEPGPDADQQQRLIAATGRDPR